MAEFWANPGTEPKRIYRWVMRMNINNPLMQIDEWLIKRASRPSWSLTESQHSFINHTFYYPGRINYDDLNITLVDSISPNAAVNLQSLLAASGYVTPEKSAEGGADGYKTVSKAGWTSANGAGLGNVQIVQMDQDGNTLETWNFYNTWIKSCNLGELNYESDDLLNIDLVVRYDYFKIGAGGLGALSLGDIADTFQAS